MNMTYEQYFEMLGTENECLINSIVCEAAAIQAELEFNECMYGDSSDVSDSYGLESSSLALTLYDDDIDNDTGAASYSNNYTVATEAGFFEKIKSGFKAIGEWFKKIGNGIKAWFVKMKEAITRKITEMKARFAAKKAVNMAIDIGVLITEREREMNDLNAEKTKLEQQLSGASGRKQEGIQRRIAAIKNKMDEINKRFDANMLKKADTIGKAASHEVRAQLKQLQDITKEVGNANDKLCTIERKLLELGANKETNSSLRNYSGIRGEQEKAGNVVGQKGILDSSHGDKTNAKKILSDSNNQRALKNIESSSNRVKESIEAYDVKGKQIGNRIMAILAFTALGTAGGEIAARSSNGAVALGGKFLITAARASLFDAIGGLDAIADFDKLSQTVATDCGRMVSECEALEKLTAYGTELEVANKAIAALRTAAGTVQTVAGTIMKSSKVLSDGAGGKAQLAAAIESLKAEAKSAIGSLLSENSEELGMAAGEELGRAAGAVAKKIGDKIQQ